MVYAARSLAAPKRFTTEVLEQFWTDMERYRDDPVSMAHEVFQIEILIDKQIEIMRSVAANPATLVVSCTGYGKTFVAALLVLWWIFTRPYSKCITTASTYTQVRNVLWGAIRHIYSTVDRFMGFECLDTRLEIAPEWLAIGMSVRDPSAIQGQHAPGGVLGIIDEAQGVRQDIWDAYERLGMDPDDRQVAFCNPFKKSTPDYKASQKPKLWNTITCSGFDHINVQQRKTIIRGAITIEWIERQTELYGKNSPIYKSTVLALYPDDDDQKLIPYSWLKRALDLWAEDKDSHRETPSQTDDTLHLGVDIARMGADKSVAILRCGYTVINAWEWTKARTTESAEKIKKIMVEAGMGKSAARRVRIDVSNAGGGVVDELVKQGYKIVPVNFGSGPKGDMAGLVGEEQKFLNRRAELHWAARRLFETERIIIPRAPFTDILIADLAASDYEVTDQGKIKIQPKEEIIASLGRSPDYGDAFVISLAGPGGMKPIKRINALYGTKTNFPG